MSAGRIAQTELDQVVKSLGSNLEALRGRRLLLTGGTGFFGRWLLESLCHANRVADLGLRIVVLTRDPGAFSATAPHLVQAREVTLHQGDVRSFEPPGGGFDFVLHGAATSDARAYASDPLGMLDTIVMGTRRVLNLAHDRGANRVLFVSSGAVYGPQPRTLMQMPETYLGAPDPLDATMIYAESKRMAEQLCAIACDKNDLVVPVARCFAFAGPHLPLDQHFAMGNFVRDALRGGPVRVAGDGTPVRSYLHGSDLASWLLTILIRGQAKRAYNVGSDRAVSIAELARLVAHTIGTDVTLGALPVEGELPARYVPDVSRARAELGLTVRVSLSEAIESMMAFHRARPERKA